MSITAGDDWRAELTAVCAAFSSGFEAIADHDGTAPSIVQFVAAVQQVSTEGPRFESVAVPPAEAAAVDEIIALATEAESSLAAAGPAAAAGDAPAAEQSLDVALAGYSSVAGQLALVGVPCADADPARAANAALSVPVDLGPWQIAAGFDSIWVSQMSGTGVVRLDPATGATVATIDIGDDPLKLQPADGRMWVRAAQRYVAIDPATNTVVATLAKADVGPNANRSWAVDGAMWICDGRRLHRYDPTTVEPVAVVELDVDCGQVTATDELVVAWSYNEDDGESGSSAAAFVDPSTNTVIATVPLPVDVGVPVVLDDVVFFAGYGGPTAVVVDRATWSVVATPDLGRPTSGSLSVTDGERIFVPTDDPKDVLVVDAATFAVVETIEPLGNNGVALLDGSLWTADAAFGLVQRFELA